MRRISSLISLGKAFRTLVTAAASREAVTMRRRARPSWREIAQFAEALAAVSIASAAIALLPFRAVVRVMNVGAMPEEAKLAGGSAAARIRLAVERASRRLPWRTVCFHRGLAVHWMLRRRGLASRVHYGLRQNGERLSAHVWVTLAGEVVIGEERGDPHACIAVFPAD